MLSPVVHLLNRLITLNDGGRLLIYTLYMLFVVYSIHLSDCLYLLGISTDYLNRCVCFKHSGQMDISHIFM